MHHDSSYKLIFANPEMMRDLFVGFVNEPWVADIDFSTLERFPNTYITDDLRRREDDIIWRVNIKGHTVYVYILLEFQASVDQFMAVRIMGYLALLYQDLIQSNNLAEGGKLPPVFPMVLYNGQAKWWAKRDISDFIEKLPGGLAQYVPQLRYFLLEIGAVDESAQFALKNLAAAMMRLEKSRDPQAMLDAMSALIEWLNAPERRRLRRAFAVWIRRVLLPGRLPGVTLPEVGNLLEIKTMLAERVIEWTAQWKEEGRQEGMQTGIQTGIQTGKAQLLQELLESRFTPLPDWALARLQHGSEAELSRWCLRVLNYSSLQEILN
jgi:predicted transposase YdaD